MDSVTLCRCSIVFYSLAEEGIMDLRKGKMVLNVAGQKMKGYWVSCR